MDISYKVKDNVLQLRDPEMLSNKEGFSRDKCISLGRRNRKDFVKRLGESRIEKGEIIGGIRERREGR